MSSAATGVRFTGGASADVGDELLQTGQVSNQSALAEFAQITPARLTQILTLFNLAPDIREELSLMPKTTVRRREIQEKAVRRITMEMEWQRQREKQGKCSQSIDDLNAEL